MQCSFMLDLLSTLPFLNSHASAVKFQEAQCRECHTPCIDDLNKCTGLPTTSYCSDGGEGIDDPLCTLAQREDACEGQDHSSETCAELGCCYWDTLAGTCNAACFVPWDGNACCATSRSPTTTAAASYTPSSSTTSFLNLTTANKTTSRPFSSDSLQPAITPLANFTRTQATPVPSPLASLQVTDAAIDGPNTTFQTTSSTPTLEATTYTPILEELTNTPTTGPAPLNASLTMSPVVSSLPPPNSPTGLKSNASTVTQSTAWLLVVVWMTIALT